MNVTNLTLEGYPTADLLKLLANILTHIAQSNDRNPPVSIATSAPNPSTLTLTSAAKSVLLPCSPTSPTSPTSPYSTSATASTMTNTAMPLTFHARNVPTISLESYLLRILKYCPTSNFVFLSLLVYFDRMAALSLASSGCYVHRSGGGSCNGMPSGMGASASGMGGRKVFRVDSYNVHRLVIAGVTVASKFFSDVFYTNSRYAKVGGLPLPELNQLELQFLLLNDFRLVISPQQMHLYTQHLLRFSLEHTPPSMGVDVSVLAASLGVGPGIGFGLNPVHASLGFPNSSRHQPHVPVPILIPRPPVKKKNKRTTPATPTTTRAPTRPALSSFFSPPSSPPLRPCAPSPSPPNSSSSSLSSSPSASPRPKMITNGHPTHAPSHSNHSNSKPHSVSHAYRTRNVHHSKGPSFDEDGTDGIDSDDFNEEDSDEVDEDQEETETLTSTSTDDDSEPTIRGPRTVVGWEGEARRSP